MVEGEYLSGAWRVYARSVAFVLGVLFAVGIAGHALPAALPAMRSATPPFLLLAAVLVLVPSVVAGGRRFVLWLAAAFAFVFLLDAAGLAVPTVFGAFAFGPHLGWTCCGVPLLVTLNWVLIMNGAVCVAGRLVPPALGRGRMLLRVLLSGLLAVGFDGIMEPAAIRLDYWHWPDAAGAPAGNYLVLFLFAMVFTAIHPRRLRDLCDLGTNGRLAGFYLLMETGFFAALRLVWWVQAA